MESISNIYQSKESLKFCHIITENKNSYIVAFEGKSKKMKIPKSIIAEYFEPVGDIYRYALCIVKRSKSPYQVNLSDREVYEIAEHLLPELENYGKVELLKLYKLIRENYGSH